MHPTYICTTCGTQRDGNPGPPENCIICEDDRQWVPRTGQSWVAYEDVLSGHTNDLAKEEPGLYSVGVQPTFAIGQRAYLVRSDAIMEMGGISAIALSHPHFHTSMAEWSEAFHGAPIYIHVSDRERVVRKRGNFDFWSGVEKEIVRGITLVNCGGHSDSRAAVGFRV